MKKNSLLIFDGFIETAFERRFQGLLHLAWKQRSWHVIVADPGSGKSMGIRDLVRTSKGNPFTLTRCGRKYPIIAVTAPKNDPKEGALGNYLLQAVNFPVQGRWSGKRSLLACWLNEYEVECLIIDDAHDLSMQHLILLKEVTDQLKFYPYNRTLGLCLVTAGRGASIPLKDILDQPETMWIQFRRRLDRIQPYCRIANHTLEELRDILGALEKIYRPYLPSLNLQRWSGSIYSWLTHPLLDPQNSRRVNMDNLMKLITTALELTYSQGEADVTARTLEAAAEIFMIKRETVHVIDAPVTKEVQIVINEDASIQTSKSPPKKRRRGKVRNSEIKSELP